MVSIKSVSGIFFGIILLIVGIIIFVVLFANQRIKPHTPCAGEWGPVTYLHRGNVSFAQENTFDAIVNGTSFRGYNPEMDVMALKDGGVVLFHDDNMLRLTGVDKEIRDIDTAEALSTPILQEIDGYVYNSTNSIPELLSVVDAICDADENIGINFDTKSIEAVETEISILKNSSCVETRDNIIFSTPYPGVVKKLKEELKDAGMDNHIAIYMPQGKFSIFGLKFFLKTRLLQGFIARGSSILSLHKKVHDVEQDIIQSWVDDGWCIGIWGITFDEVSQYEADYYVVDDEPVFPDNVGDEKSYDDDSLVAFNVLIAVALFCLLAGIALLFFAARCARRERANRNVSESMVEDQA